jgi:phosphonate transport system substrate-binding protein
MLAVRDALSRRLAWIAAAIALFAVLANGSARADIALAFGVYSSDKPSAMVEQVRPTLNALERDLTASLKQPVRITMQVFRTYEEGIEALVAKRVDFMRLGAVSYFTAKRQDAGIRILAVEVNDGGAIQNGVICVRSDSAIKTLADLRGKSFAFGDKNSTLGRYVAQLFLVKAGIRSGDLASFDYLDRHDRVGAAVGAGQYDAGALEQTMFKKLVAEGVPIRALATYPNATKPWPARHGLEPRLFDALRQALLHIDDPKALELLRFDGFAMPDEAALELTRQAIEENDSFFAAKN